MADDRATPANAESRRTAPDRHRASRSAKAPSPEPSTIAASAPSIPRARRNAAAAPTRASWSIVLTGAITLQASHRRGAPGADQRHWGRRWPERHGLAGQGPRAIETRGVVVVQVEERRAPGHAISRPPPAAECRRRDRPGRRRDRGRRRAAPPPGQSVRHRWPRRARRPQRRWSRHGEPGATAPGRPLPPDRRPAPPPSPAASLAPGHRRAPSGPSPVLPRGAAAAPASSTARAPRASTSVRRSAGPPPCSTSMHSAISRALPDGATERRVHGRHERLGAHAVRACRSATSDRASASASSIVFMNAPRPHLTSSTSAVAALGELLAHDRRRDERHALDRRGHVAQRIEHLVGGSDVGGLSDDGAPDLAEHRDELLGRQRRRESRESTRACRGCRRYGRGRGPTSSA